MTEKETKKEERVDKTPKTNKYEEALNKYNTNLDDNEVREVVNLSEDEIDKVSNKGRFINGIGKHGDQLISLLEINALVEENN